jgi:hypothetical protein
MLNTGCLVNGVSGLTGTGNWYWNTQGGSLYAVGSGGTPYGAYPSTPVLATPVPHTQLLGGGGNNNFTILDLSGATAVATTYNNPPLNLEVTTNWEYPYPFAATSSSVWVVGGASGELVDGASLAGQVRYFDYGEPLAIAGSTTNVAVATATGRLLVIDTATGTIETTISTPLGSPPTSLMLSDDGTVLTVVQNLPSSPGEPTTTIYALPAGTAATSLPQGVYTTLSASGTALGKIWFSDCTATAQTIATGQIFWTTGSANDCYISGLQLSPDASEIAVEEGGVTSIYQNGAFVTTISASGLTWLGDGELLAITSKGCCSVYSSTGMLMTSLTLPNLLPYAIPAPAVEVVPPTANPTAIYTSLTNSIYALSNGAVIWTSDSQSSPAIVTDYPLGVVSGSFVVFQSGNLLLAEPY